MEFNGLAFVFGLLLWFCIAHHAFSFRRAITHHALDLQGVSVLICNKAWNWRSESRISFIILVFHADFQKGAMTCLKDHVVMTPPLFILFSILIPYILKRKRAYTSS
jgi:hypothetical protein